jgi:predicted phage tail protein
VDDVAIPLTLVHRDALQYSHRLAGRDDSWSAWTAMTRVDYDGLAPGHYRFEVRARDVSGNVSEPATREFAIGESIRRRAAGPQPMRAATLGPELTPNYSRLADN